MESFECKIGDVVIMTVDDPMQTYVGVVEDIDIHTTEYKSADGVLLEVVQEEIIGVRFFSLVGEPSFNEDVEYMHWRNLDVIGNVDEWDRELCGSS